MYLGDFPVIMSWIVLCAVVRLQPGQLLAVAGVRQKGWHPLQNIPDMWMSAMEVQSPAKSVRRSLLLCIICKKVTDLRGFTL